MSTILRTPASIDEELFGKPVINIGTGLDITIAEFARMVAATVGYTGEISFDSSRPTARRANCRCQPACQTEAARDNVAAGCPVRLSGVSQRAKQAAGERQGVR
jgi:nucleoside-diphosphate-sugar epimerase